MIGIDGNEANVSERVGSNVYAHKLLMGLAHQPSPFEYKVFLKTQPLADMPKESASWQYRVLGQYPLWTRWRLPWELYTHPDNLKVMFTPGHYAPRFSPIPRVITVLDLAFLFFPDAFKPKVLRQLTTWTKQSVESAAHILTISEHTKKDLISSYQVEPSKITVTYPGSDVEVPNSWTVDQKEKIKRKYGISTPFFLFIGTRQPRKNLATLLSAFAKLHSKTRNISLVIAGKTWHQFAESHLEAHPQVITTGYVDNADLKALTMSAQALVFPSLYEGFGLPVLEAMRLGTPVVASNVSSLPEITGETSLLFDPTDVYQLVAKLDLILKLKPESRKKIIREGKIRARQFTWERTVKQTIEVLGHFNQ